MPGTGLGILRHDGAAVVRRHPAGRKRRPGAARGCSCSPSRPPCRPSTGRATWTTWRSGGSARRPARSSASTASSGCTPRPPTPSRSPASRCCAARSTGCLRSPGVPADSHDGKALHRDPRGLPARGAVRDQRGAARPDRRWPCSASPSASRCGCSCVPTPTAATSPAWSTCRGTGTPRRSGCAPRRYCAARSAASRSTTARWWATRPWPGCTSWCTPRPAAPSPRSTRRRSQARIAAAVRSWDEDLAAEAERQLGSERATAVLRDLRQQHPRDLQGGHSCRPPRSRTWRWCSGCARSPRRSRSAFRSTRTSAGGCGSSGFPDHAL